MADYNREPCPDRILDDVGGAFSMGAVGGSVWHFFKGLKNSPRGERLLGGTTAVQLNAPRIGGSFAVWGGLFSAFDCAMVAVRNKEDPWNSIAAGFFTGGFLQLRAGPRSALQSAVFGGVLLGLIEGAGIMLNRMTASLPPPPPTTREEPMVSAHQSLGSAQKELPQSSSMEITPALPPPTTSASLESSESKSSSSGMFGWFFGQKTEEPSAAGTVVLSSGEHMDSFDANPPPPTPDFGGSNDSFLKGK